MPEAPPGAFGRGIGIVTGFGMGVEGIIGDTENLQNKFTGWTHSC